MKQPCVYIAASKRHRPGSFNVIASAAKQSILLRKEALHLAA
jgi:hypothetical protein